jgi:hypothetical protein
MEMEMKDCFFTPCVAIVIRWFQAGCGYSDSKYGGEPKLFDEADFEARFARPLRTFLSSAGSEVKCIVVVSNGDTRFGLGELVNTEGETTTSIAIRRTFPREVESGFLSIVIDDEWGNNAGSAHALNTGWRLATDQDERIDHILSWNPELQMTGSILARMLTHLERHYLDFVGVYRKRYWLLYQWRLAQNTACLYPVKVLRRVNGFSAGNCDGNDRATIAVPGIGSVTRAGMDDFDLALRLWLSIGRPPRWGMVGRADPFLWDVDFTPGTARAIMLQQKIARQPSIIEAWVNRHFPDQSFSSVMDAFFASGYSD